MMTEVVSDSDSDGEITGTRRPNPPPKRRCVVDPSSITAVPIYSSKVNRCLKLKPVAFRQVGVTEGDEEEVPLWSSTPPKSKTEPMTVTLSDSEEEPEQKQPQEDIKSPSPPPPPCNPAFTQTHRAKKKIREINKKLNAIGSLMCPSPERPEDIPQYSDHSSSTSDYDDDDDIIIISSKDKNKKPLAKPREKVRKISLKFRWRTDVYKIPVLSTDPLIKAVDQLSIKLKVPSSQIMLLRKDTELPLHSTAIELNLGIADIIDCVVITEDKDEESKGGDVITVRLQGKDKGSAQEYALHKDAPLGSVLSQYTSSLPVTAKRKVVFLFDGSKVSHVQTPSQLDMEDGDVIEVWT
ncbi:NFATC2-interacting protein [Brachyhypopomus gauderio]|uniref:NFATC2-interacting protein n=1 Tax=Brachyhypopomus gauderio TaxID=698409 RepID=UPI004041DAF6